MIISFRDQMTADIFFDRETGASRRFPGDIRPIVKRKLEYLNSAGRLRDLNVPPGNRLEQLRGKLRGMHSIRVNDKWRIVFRWDDGARDVFVTDYHS